MRMYNLQGINVVIQQTTFITNCASVSYKTVCLYTGETADEVIKLFVYIPVKQLIITKYFQLVNKYQTANIDCLDYIHVFVKYLLRGQLMF